MTLNFRMATALADLAQGANFFVLGIREPTLAYFVDHVVRYSQSRGGQARQGYNQATLFWDELNPAEAAVIKAKIEAAEALTEPGNGTLYVTLPKNDASSHSPGWVDVSGVAVMPQWVPEQNSKGWIFSNVTLLLNNVTVETEPSSLVT
jgi:hypothetical protein